MIADFKKSCELIVKDKNITLGAKALYFYILVCKKSKDITLQSRSEIASDLNISNLTLGKYLKELTINGYLKHEQSKINGRFGNNLYTILGWE